MKIRLSQDQEFKVLLSVIDKVLWLGFAGLGIGLYKMLDSSLISSGIFYLLSGAVILFLFIFLLIKEFQFSR